MLNKTSAIVQMGPETSFEHVDTCNCCPQTVASIDSSTRGSHLPVYFLCLLFVLNWQAKILFFPPRTLEKHPVFDPSTHCSSAGIMRERGGKTAGIDRGSQPRRPHGSLRSQTRVCHVDLTGPRAG